MIGYLSGKFLAAEDSSILVDVAGVGYSVLVAQKVALGLAPGMPVELYIHTNLRENALELFGFQSSWEKRVFHALVSVSGVGPKTALAVIGGLDAETVLSAIVREDRATLTSVPGVGKKTAELLIIQIAEKARKLLAERPSRGTVAAVPAAAVAAHLAAEASGGSSKKKRAAGVPAQGASASAKPGQPTGLELADLWNEALAALANLGYRDTDAIAAIKIASGKMAEAGEVTSLEKLIMTSLQLMSRGL
ncbi:MAG: Holliday junction branch migration protein RuvA [Deltaproteobacteria bacterium]|nr:Holliday junction branch migration protein RuvA [Deltaproteobacteria bacterium]